jgi:hypothetical protein
MSSESLHQQMGYSSSAKLLYYSPQRLWIRILTLICILLTFTRGEGARVAMIYFVMEAYKRRLLKQRPLSEPLLIQAAGNLYSSHDHHSNYA